MQTIIDSIWFSSLCPVYNLGAVLIETRNKKLKVYMGTQLSTDQKIDEENFAKWGCKMPIPIAQAMFPQYDPQLFIY